MLPPRTIAFAGDSARLVREDSPNDQIEIGEKCAFRAKVVAFQSTRAARSSWLKFQCIPS